MMTIRRSVYWDYPDPFLPAEEDPFSIFAFEMGEIDRQVGRRTRSWAHRARQEALERYSRRREELLALFDLEDPQERLQRGFLREHYTALMFWSGGSCLDPPPREDGTPWT